MSSLKKIFHYLVAFLAALYYGYPSRELIVIGVTGTKGKSSTCRFIASVLEAGGHRVGLLSTVEFQIADKRLPNDKKMTMLGRGRIQKMLRKMVLAGCKYAVIETSSEGILQYRHIGIWYDICVFTNLGSEHSERHGGFEYLKRDKGILFDRLFRFPDKKIDGKKVDKIIIANSDDPNADYFLGFKADKKITFAVKNQASVKPENVTSEIGCSIFNIQNSTFRVNIQGSFNVYNALAAVAVGRSQNISDNKILEGIASVTSIPGRMEFIAEGQSFHVVVDYAHEPMSLTELFTNLRKIAGSDKRIISVIGSDGGGRDKEKRKKMGEIAAKLTDKVVVTDVNCYDESPSAIAEVLATGAREAGKKDGENLFIEIDRKNAIDLAFQMAKTGDVVAITAKGTEPFMAAAKGKKIPWDDRIVARKLLAKFI